ncbi:hypothetical protein D3C72_976870 [compost metagenome]
MQSQAYIHIGDWGSTTGGFFTEILIYIVYVITRAFRLFPEFNTTIQYLCGLLVFCDSVLTGFSKAAQVISLQYNAEVAVYIIDQSCPSQSHKRYRFIGTVVGIHWCDQVLILCCKGVHCIQVLLVLRVLLHQRAYPGKYIQVKCSEAGSVHGTQAQRYMLEAIALLCKGGISILEGVDITACSI